MKKLLWLATAMLVAGSLSASVQAQRTRTASSQPEVVEHDFEDAENVEGDRNTPWGDRLTRRRRGQRRSLIQPRYSFTPELRQSLENI